MRDDLALSNAHDEPTRKLCLNGCFTVKPVTDFAPNPRSPDGYQARCRPCEADRALLVKHGMTRAQRSAIAEAQGGCRVCDRTDPGGKGWVVDHDRSCCPGERSCGLCRRGVLCQWCNTALGYAGDSPDVLRRLAAYIESGERLNPEINPRRSRTLPDVLTVRSS